MKMNFYSEFLDFEKYQHISGRIISSLLILLLLVSCVREEVIDESFEFSRKPVVFCLISPKKTIELFLSNSFVLGDNKIHPSTQGIFNANVLLSNVQSDTVNLSIQEAGVPVYSSVSNFPIEEGHTYFLTITIPGYTDTIKASTTIPKSKIKFDSVQFLHTPYEVKEYHEFVNSKGVDWTYATYFDYNVIFTNNSNFNYLIFKYPSGVFPINENIDIIRIGRTYIFQESILIKRQDSARITTYDYFNNNNNWPIKYKVITTSPELEEYFRVYEIQYNNTEAVDMDLFLEFFRGVAPEYTNIINGLGVFAGYLEDEITVEVEQ